MYLMQSCCLRDSNLKLLSQGRSMSFHEPRLAPLKKPLGFGHTVLDKVAVFPFLASTYQLLPLIVTCNQVSVLHQGAA